MAGAGQARLNGRLGEAMSRTAVVPVLTIDTADAGVATARALVRGGLRLVEVTLRTPEALAAIRRIAVEVPDAIVGAGTVLTPDQGAQAIAAGARFLVSPGMTPALIEAAQSWPVAFLPGAATASEAMALSSLGYGLLKFFPAEPAGGLAYLKALAAPLPGIAFCPTGGITPDSAPRYLALPNVAAVGGSWLTPADAVRDGDWARIEQLAAKAAALALPSA